MLLQILNAPQMITVSSMTEINEALAVTDLQSTTGYVLTKVQAP